jgi:hypothetical protein
VQEHCRKTGDGEHTSSRRVLYIVDQPRWERGDVYARCAPNCPYPGAFVIRPSVPHGRYRPEGKKGCSSSVSVSLGAVWATAVSRGARNP